MTAKAEKIGLLLLNLGTPKTPEPADVGQYLREFLMDPLVIDIPAVWRWILVNILIVPRRAKASSELYKKIWSPTKGSPLLFHTEELTKKVKGKLSGKMEVEFAMRYGEPTLEAGIQKLKQAGVSKILAFPLYPQYSLAATESSEVKVKEICEREKLTVSFVPPFYKSSAYLDAVATVSAPFVRKKPHDFVLFSFHGLPERQVKKTDRGDHCFKSETCSEVAVPENQNCYRHQCYITAKELAQRLHINPLRYSVSFQSRLGRTPWIQPFSDKFYELFPQRGIKRLLVLCPSFVADCLETLEEVEIRGKKQFKDSGGDDLYLVPSLNSDDVWVDAVLTLVNDSLYHPSAGHEHEKSRPAHQHQESQGIKSGPQGQVTDHR